MNLKKVLCIILAVAIAACFMTGCKKGKTPEDEIKDALKKNGEIHVDENTKVEIVEDPEVEDKTGAKVIVVDNNGKREVVVIDKDGNVTVVVPGVTPGNPPDGSPSEAASDTAPDTSSGTAPATSGAVAATSGASAVTSTPDEGTGEPPETNVMDITGSGKYDIIIVTQEPGESALRMYIYLNDGSVVTSNLMIKEGTLTFQKAADKLVNVFLTTDSLPKRIIGQFELIYELEMDYAHFKPEVGLQAEYLAVLK